jgi:hypothetical protein
MTTFVFTELVNSPHADVVSAALGVNAAGKFSDKDIGKPVKMAANNNYVLCALNDEIEGFVKSVEALTTNDGFSFGSVMKNTRVTAQVDAAQTGTLVVGELCAAGTSAALGTANTYPKVIQGTPANHKWRVIRNISGTGVAGDLVLIEKI